jgi:malonyl-CoA/methylmalonyl-CoA synthetase
MTGAETLLARLRDVARTTPERIAVADDSSKRSFAELMARASRVRAGLEKRGFGHQRVGLFASSGASWVEAFVGCLLARCTAVALSPIYPPSELAFLLRASGTHVVLVSRDLEEQARVALGKTTTLVIETLAETDGEPGGIDAAARASDPALVLFTSGTTGKPKGAKPTHENVLSLADTLGRAWGFSPGDVLLHTLPLHHLHGNGVSLLVALASGATTRFVPFEPNRVWDELGQATVLMGVPTQHKKLFDALDAASDETRRRWTSHGRALRLVTSGSAALPTAVGERWRSLSGRYPLERYGMTEIGIVLSNSLDGERRPGTVGKPLPGVDMRLVGDGGHDVATGEPGDLWIRARTVFAGYDDNDAATREAFSGDWFKTGDSARSSDDGYVTILGRTSVDILKSGGYKLSAVEIENVLREHEGIVDVAVVGVPDDTWGDLVVAAIVEKPGWTTSEGELRTWAKERVAPYKVPKRIVVLEDLPRNALGKVQKNTLVRLLTERGQT